MASHASGVGSVPSGCVGDLATYKEWAAANGLEDLEFLDNVQDLMALPNNAPTRQQISDRKVETSAQQPSHVNGNMSTVHQKHIVSCTLGIALTLLVAVITRQPWWAISISLVPWIVELVVNNK